MTFRQVPSELGNSATFASVEAHRDHRTADLLELVGCSTSRLDAAFRRAGLERRRVTVANRHPQLNHPRWLRANRHRSARELAAEFDCSTTAIYQAYRRLKIERPRAQRPFTYTQLHDRAWLRENRRRSATELAAEIGCSPSTIDRAYRRMGIQRNRR